MKCKESVAIGNPEKIKMANGRTRVYIMYNDSCSGRISKIIS